MIDVRFWPSTIDVARAVVDPEVVVAADVAGRAGRSVAADRRRGAVAVARPRRAFGRGGHLLLELARLLVGHRSCAERGRPLERRQRRES